MAALRSLAVVAVALAFAQVCSASCGYDVGLPVLPGFPALPYGYNTPLINPLLAGLPDVSPLALGYNTPLINPLLAGLPDVSPLALGYSPALGFPAPLDLGAAPYLPPFCGAPFPIPSFPVPLPTPTFPLPTPTFPAPTYPFPIPSYPAPFPIPSFPTPFPAPISCSCKCRSY